MEANRMIAMTLESILVTHAAHFTDYKPTAPESDMQLVHIPDAAHLTDYKPIVRQSDIQLADIHNSAQLTDPKPKALESDQLTAACSWHEPCMRRMMIMCVPRMWHTASAQSNDGSKA